jgi:glyoxylase-like metal-dependent hydrolase (beta-lactamase superfamily II)
MILERLELGPFASNCYIVGDESAHEGFVIDPGADAGHILKRAKTLELTIKTIVLTHTHPDHIGAVKAVKEATKGEVAVHPEDSRALGSPSPMAAMHGFPPQSVAPDRLLKGGDSIKAGNLSFLVLHTPGHSPGGICLLGEGVVFTGDTLFNMSIGRSDFPGGNYNLLLTSIHTKLMVLPDSTIVYPGHGPESTIGDERRGNPFLRGR